MAATKQIFTKFALTGQSLVKKWRTEFHENPTNVLVANVRSQRDRPMYVRGIHTGRFFFLHKKNLTTIFTALLAELTL
jgi:hypothetical protein